MNRADLEAYTEKLAATAREMKKLETIIHADIDYKLFPSPKIQVSQFAFRELFDPLECVFKQVGWEQERGNRYQVGVEINGVFVFCSVCQKDPGYDEWRSKMGAVFINES